MVIPPLSWRRDLRYAYSVVCFQSISAGFVRLDENSFMHILHERPWANACTDLSYFSDRVWLHVVVLQHTFTFFSLSLSHRVPVETSLIDSRYYISKQLNGHLVPAQYVLLRKVGRYLTMVRGERESYLH